MVFTGSQVPIAEPHSDARQNLIMALIFAAREVPICEVTIFFHDRLIRACRATKVNTNDLHVSCGAYCISVLSCSITFSHRHLIPPTSSRWPQRVGET